VNHTGPATSVGSNIVKLFMVWLWNVARKTLAESLMYSGMEHSSARETYVLSVFISIIMQDIFCSQGLYMRLKHVDK
jgi:hypothetical protein